MLDGLACFDFSKVVIHKIQEDHKHEVKKEEGETRILGRSGKNIGVENEKNEDPCRATQFMKGNIRGKTVTQLDTEAEDKL